MEPGEYTMHLLSRLVVELTVRAATAEVEDRGLTVKAQANVEDFITAIREETKAVLHEILEELRGIDPEAPIPLVLATWHELLNARCNLAARRAVAAWLAVEEGAA